MKKPSRPRFFNKEHNGFVELYFSSEDVVAILEVLAFTRKLCDSLVSKNEDISNEVRDMLIDKGVAARLLEEKVRADADPGKPLDSLH